MRLYLDSEPLHGRSGHEAGRSLLERMYRRETGEEMPPIALTDRGKPYFTAGGWHFSISHTKNTVWCALCDRNVGLDAEEWDRPIRLALADKILSPGERAQYDRAPDKRAALLTFWVLKEAGAKRSGEGLRGYPNHTDFSLDHPGVFHRGDCVVAVLTEED